MNRNGAAEFKHFCSRGDGGGSWRWWLRDIGGFPAGYSLPPTPLAHQYSYVYDSEVRAVGFDGLGPRKNLCQMVRFPMPGIMYPLFDPIFMLFCAQYVVPLMRKKVSNVGEIL